MISRLFDRNAPYGQIGVIAAIYAIGILIFQNDSTISIITLAATLAAVAVGVDVTLGYGGLLAFSATGFMLIGAQGTGLVTTHWGIKGTAGTLLGMGFGVLLSAIVAIVVGCVTLRVKGLGLALVTIFLTFIALGLVVQFQVLGGSFGVTGVPSFQLGPFVAKTPFRKSLVALGLLLVVLLVAARMMSSDAAREIKAVRDNEQAAAASGVAVGRRKVEAFVLGSLIASVAGSVYAQSQNFVGATSFEIHVLLTILLYLYIGGIGTLWGAALGALVVEFVPKYLHFIGRARFMVEGLAFLIILVSSQGGIASGIAKLRRAALKREPQVTGLGRPSDAALDAVISDQAPESTVAALVVEDLTVEFGGLRALDRVAISVPDRAIHALIGPNGAGKSTLFNAITGVVHPQTGTVHMHGVDITGLSSTRVARAGLGRTFQTVRLFGKLTVLENVLVGARGANRDWLVTSLVGRRRKRLAEAWRALQRLGIEDIALQRADSLPLGTQRLVEVARALAGRPRILLLDEPASGLSAGERDDLAVVLRGLRGEVTMVLVEHDIPFVAALADSVTVLESGTLIFDGAVEDALNDRRVIESYLGDSQASAAGEVDR